MGNLYILTLKLRRYMPLSRKLNKYFKFYLFNERICMEVLDNCGGREGNS